MKKRPIGFVYEKSMEESKHDDRAPEHGDNPVVEPNPAKQDAERDDKEKEEKSEKDDEGEKRPTSSAAVSAKNNVVSQHIYAQPGGKAIGRLEVGEVEVKEERGPWSRIDSGWIQSKFLR